MPVAAGCECDDFPWIAAATQETGGVLFTRDRHFLKIPMFDTIGLEDASS